MILSDEEILSAVRGFYGTPEGAFMGSLDDIQTARAIEAAILAKLASAELPEPVVFDGSYLKNGEWEFEDGYTADQLRQAYAQGAAAQLAEKPSAWKWKVNRFHRHLEDYCPPDDAYDEGTLVELYTRRQA